jgi:hypothetical protein
MGSTVRTDPARTAALALAVAAACGGASTGGPPPEENGGAPPERPRVTIALRFEEAPDDPTGAAPRTRVSVAVIARGEPTRTTEVALVAGACSHAWPGHAILLRARCTWADRREEITVAQRGDQLLIRTAAGNEQRIGLPESALVDVLQPETMPTEGGTGGVFINPEPIREH